MTELEDLLVLNDQIVSLARSGYPLPLGLAESGRDTAEALGQVNAAVTRRVVNGATLAEALTGSQDDLPPAYWALLQIGIKCRRLPIAVECLERNRRLVTELRHSLRTSLVYPLILVGFVLLLTVVYGLFLVPLLQQSFIEFDLQPTWSMAGLRTLQAAVPWVVAIAAMALVIGVGVRWFRRRSLDGERIHAGRSSFWGLQPIEHDQDLVSLSELTAAMVEQQVPLDESLRLAALATGNESLRRAVLAGANSPTTHPSATELRPPALGGWPPLIDWLAAQGTTLADLPDVLRVAADVYRTRGERRANWLRWVLPMVFCAVIGGGATLAYCLLLFVPLTQLVYELS